MFKAARLSRQFPEVLGRKITSRRQTFPMWIKGAFVLVWLIVAGAMMFNDQMERAPYLVATVILLLLAYAVVTQVRIVLFEHGFAFGWWFPLVRPRVIAYRELDASSVRVYTNIGAILSRTPEGPWFPGWYALIGSRKGISWIGPQSNVTGAGSRSQRPGGAGGRELRLFAHWDAAKLTRIMAEQLAADGFVDRAQQLRYAADHPVTLQGRGDEIVRDVPGLGRPRGR